MSILSPASVLVDVDGDPLAVDDGVSIPSGTPVLLTAGSDSGTAHVLRTAGDGTLRIDPIGSTAQPVTDGGGSITVDGPITDSELRATAVAISAATLPLPVGAATELTLGTRASAGQLPAALVGGRLDANVGAWLGATAPTVGQKSSAASIPVVLAADQSAISVTMAAPASALAGIAFGEITLSTVTTAAVYKTAYSEQSANFTGSVRSSNAADSAAGTGARTIRIFWMNAAGDSVGTEDVTLDGTTAVNLAVTTKCFIEKIEVLTVGSTGSNVGTISLFTGSGGTGTVVGTIAPGDNQTLWAHHYVEAGKTFRLTGITAGSTSTISGGGSSFQIRAKTIGVANSAERQIADTITVYGQSSQIVRPYDTAIPLVQGPASVKMFCTTRSSTSIIYRGSFDYYDD